MGVESFDHSTGTFGSSVGSNPLRNAADLVPTPDDRNRQLLAGVLRHKLFGEQFGPIRVGRFSMLSCVGSGAMGVVYAAYDDRLDRKVAIKFIHRERAASPALRGRFLREARAMARVSHGNVAQVYEAGEFDDQLYIAMEFVEGKALREWMSERWPWRTVLDMFLAAGRGLAAAHAAGVVHRDFKPDNVLVGAGGVPKVVDFGLAGLVPGDSSTHVEESGRSHDMGLTETGQVMGTPRYMAPEQHRGLTSDVASDQFSFCVALFEGLYGVRPFAGETRAALVHHVLTGRIVTPPAEATVPRWLGAVVRRGLAADSADRWPSMDALLEALQRDPSRARRWRGFGLTALAVAVAAGGLHWFEDRRAVEACRAEGQRIDGVWNAERAARIAAAFGASKAHAAVDAWERAEPWLADYARQWSNASTELCMRDAAPEAQRPAPELTAAAHQCLDEAAAEFDVLLGQLETAATQTRVVTDAVASAATLPLLESCKRERWLLQRARPPADPATASELTAIRALLAEANVLQGLSLFEAAKVPAEAALARAETLGWPAAVAETRLTLGILRSRLGSYGDARTLQEEAFYTANAAGEDLLALRSAAVLLDTVGVRQADHDTAMGWYRMAASIAERMGLRDHPDVALLASNYATLQRDRGEYEEAARSMREALSLRESLVGPEHPSIGMMYSRIGLIEEARGHYDAAIEAHQRARDIAIQALGPEDLNVAMAFNNIGNAELKRGRLDEAFEAYQRSLELKRTILGTEHPDYARSLNNLGAIYRARGDYEKVVELLQQALAIRERVFGPKHPEVITSLVNLGLNQQSIGQSQAALANLQRGLAAARETLGNDHQLVGTTLLNFGAVQAEQGDLAAAIATQREAVDTTRRALGPDHPDLAMALKRLGGNLANHGELGEAVSALRQALAIEERTLRPDHPEIVATRYRLARVHLDREEYAEAEALLRRALELAGTQVLPVGLLPSIRHRLAQALPDREPERSEAIALATQAHRDFVALGPPYAENVAEVETWLRQHGAAP